MPFLSIVYNLLDLLMEAMGIDAPNMMCVDPLRVLDQMIKFMKVNTASGAELHAYLVCVRICTCKVGFPSKNHAKEDANLLDGEYVW